MRRLERQFIENAIDVVWFAPHIRLGSRAPEAPAIDCDAAELVCQRFDLRAEHAVIERPAVQQNERRSGSRFDEKQRAIANVYAALDLFVHGAQGS
jgi:hypothetical protein